MTQALDERQEEFSAEVVEFLARNPDIKRVEALYNGFHGGYRGKLLPVAMLSQLSGHPLRFPLSTVALDVWNEDVPSLGLAVERGDPDALGVPVPGSLRRVPWGGQPTAQFSFTLFDLHTKQASKLEPRHVLEGVLDAWTQAGLTPVAATELEFHFVDRHLSASGHPQTPVPPGEDERLVNSQVYDIDVLEAFNPIIDEILLACELQNIPADTVLAEYGPGQFEINLKHVADALLAADQCLCLKRTVKAVARKHGYRAVFMAKPYGAHPGNGMHVHASVLDADGAALFASQDDAAPNPSLRNAMGGLLNSMADFQLAFAPHSNSYRRLQRGSYAPVTPCWGLDTRNAAIRVPETRGAGARFEHRVAGADANPYLVLAAILAGAIDGLRHESDPGQPIATLEDGDALPGIESDWGKAIATFESSSKVAEWFGRAFQSTYAESARAELHQLANTVTDAEIGAYLNSV